MPFKRYDLVINPVKGSSSGKLLTLITPATYKIFEFEDPNSKNEDIKHIAKESISVLRALLNRNHTSYNTSNYPLLDLKLSDKELQQGQRILNSLVNHKKKTIAIFTYATGSKCYSKSWWNTIYTQLKLNFPEYNILEILPMEHVSQINFEALTFYSKDIREIASVLAKCSVFLGGDSGIMHLASASGVPTIGVFKSRILKYKPYGRKNNAIYINSTTNASTIIKHLKDILPKKSISAYHNQNSSVLL